MAILVGLSLAVFVGYGVARICSPAGAGRAALALRVVWSPSSLRRIPLDARPEGRAGARRRASTNGFADSRITVVLNLPIIAPDVALEPIYMYFSTFRWHKLLNGYSGFNPPWYGALVDRMAAFPDDASMADLHAHDVDFVIVHGAFFRTGEVRGPGRPPRSAQGSGVRRSDRTGMASETRLYRVLRPPPADRRARGH